MKKSQYINKHFMLFFLIILIILSNPSTVFSDRAIPIYTQKDLEQIANNLSGNYKLMKDITMTGVWKPIGDGVWNTYKPEYFTGTLDGNGHVIRNLKFDFSSDGYTGIFKVNGGTIKNLGIEDSDIKLDLTEPTLNINIGFIAAINYGKIENCYNKSNIKISTVGKDYFSFYAGGIAAMQAMENSQTINCYNTGDIIANLKGKNTSTYIGGLVGVLYAGNGSKITNSYNTGRISAEANFVKAAGIAAEGSIIEYCYNTGAITAETPEDFYSGGRAYASGIISSGRVNSCYNIGPIIASSHAGGIIAGSGKVKDCFNAASVVSGYHAGGISTFTIFLEDLFGTIENCYNLGDIYGKNYSFANSIAFNSTDSEITNSYSISANLGINEDGDFTLSKEQLKNKESYKGFDFKNTWEMPSNKDYEYPVLKGLPIPAVDTTKDFAGGNGTFYSPYKVGTKKQLDNIRHYNNAYFVLINDIAFDSADFAPGGEFYNESKGWIPICKYEFLKANYVFTGLFDGKGHKISNLYSNGKNEGLGGLFGGNLGIIKNLSVVNGNITGSEVGGIAAYSEGKSQIINCHYSGKVTSSDTGFAGGICGYLGGVIKNSYCTDTIVKGRYAGGIAGMAYSTYRDVLKGRISDCYFNGSVIGSEFAGGIAGDMSYGFETINCISMGSVKGTGTIGGIVGFLYNSSVIDCYYNNQGLKGAGMLGTGYERLISKCLTPEQLKQKSTYKSFDFNNIWKLDEGMAHPVLR